MGQISKCQTSIDSNTDKYLEHTEFGASQQPNDMDGRIVDLFWTSLIWLFFSIVSIYALLAHWINWN